ncbi:MAG: histidine kinase [Muribaculaceae bacterium]|nr:histidine kinase [Muribaculaceae bacterium]
MLALLTGGEPHDMTVLSIIMSTTYTGLFCLNYFLFVPHILFSKDNKLLFFTINLLLVVFLCSLLPLWLETHGGLPRPRHLACSPLSASQWIMSYLRFIIRDVVMMILSIALAYAMCLSKNREAMTRRVLELEAERHNTELRRLKAQLNPHFLFNSLNNIYALIAINPEKAQKSLHDLSNMLRFMIYDSENASVPLRKELMFIEEYVNLMRLRINPSVRLDCHLPENPDETLTVAPLIFLTLFSNDSSRG